MAVLTIGHSSTAFPSLIELLRVHGVHRVMDVRSAPYSRFAPQFNRGTLAAELERAGIAYVYAGDYLGGRPKDPTCYFAGEVPEGKADYVHLVNYAEVARRDWFQLGIARLLQLAEQDTTAILCSEEDPFRCHRHRLVAQELRSRGIEVRHIRGDGTLEDAATTERRIRAEEGSQQLTLFGGRAVS